MFGSEICKLIKISGMGNAAMARWAGCLHRLANEGRGVGSQMPGCLGAWTGRAGIGREVAESALCSSKRRRDWNRK